MRIHNDDRAAESARAINAAAYTVGSHVVFGEGRYAPHHGDGKRLLAHELTHVIQQGSARTASLPAARSTLQRQEVEGGKSAAEFLQAGWTEVNDVGLVYKAGSKADGGGANLRKAPDGEVLTWLPQNTRVFVLKHHRKRRWYAVSTTAGGGGFGYIADWLIVRSLPDPDSEVVKINAGDTAIDIARHYYAAKGFNVWGKDARYVVNALVWVNQRARHNFPGESGLKKEDVSEGWFTAKATAGVYIWLPGANYLNAIYEQVAEHGGGTGSITADLWRGVKKVYEYVAYGVAFVGGLVHGFVKSLWDAVAGLAEMIVDILVSIFTGEVVTDAKELWEAVSKMTWEDIKTAVGNWWDKWEKKLTSNDPWTAGHAHGYLTGYIMAEAAQLLITAGTLTAAKGAVWSSRLGKIIQSTKGFKALVVGVEKLGEPASKARRVVTEAREVLKATKAFQTIKAAREWAMQALRVSADFAKNLTLEGINRLGRLPEAMRKRIAGLSNGVKQVLLGCFSPCECDTAAIKKTLDNLTDDEIERVFAPLDKARKAAEEAAAAEAKAGKAAAETEKTEKGTTAAKAAKELAAIPVEDVVQEAMALLKSRGVKGLHPTKYGTKLAAAVDEVLTKRLGKLPPGWIAGSETPLGKIVKLGPSTAKLTVREYMKKWGMLDRFPKFADDFLDTTIEALKPDLFVRAPNGRALVWDVTSKLDVRHLAKTMFYAEVIGRELGGFFRIAESYWKKVF